MRVGQARPTQRRCFESFPPLLDVIIDIPARQHMWSQHLSGRILGSSAETFGMAMPSRLWKWWWITSNLRQHPTHSSSGRSEHTELI